MSTRWVIGGVLFLLIAVATVESPSLCAQTLSPLRGQPVVLFDGTSLEGWGTRDGQPNPGWVIQEGALYRSRRAGDLYHLHWYRDFELTFQWKISAGGNSGVKYRVQQYSQQFLGCEYQIQDDQDRLLNRQATGALYAVYETAANKQAPLIGDWNHSKIVVCGHRIEHWLNGQLVVRATVGGADWLKRVAGSKFRDKPFFGQNREGRIFLQDHGQPVWFRDIVVIPLDCDLSGVFGGHCTGTMMGRFEN